MSERRAHERPEASDRRSFPRPPYWLNLSLILLGVAGILLGRIHRTSVSERFGRVIQQEARTPDDLRAIKEELAEMDLTRDQLSGELRGRRKMLSSLKSENFHIAIDTGENKLRFMYGDKVLREAPVTPGANRTVSSGTRQWTFVPLKGAFSVDGKLVGHAWEVPEWVYAMQGLPAPAQRPTVPNGLGEYVVLLPNGYVIHSPPAEESPLDGPKPGSFMVPGGVYISGKDVYAGGWPVSPDEVIVRGGAVVIPPVGTTARAIPDVLGTHRLNLGDGYALHGTQAVSQLGRSVSHGCVRLHNDDIARLYSMATVGDEVIIY